jgi:MFS family permease
VTSTFPGNIFCAFFVERFGRRKFMLIGLSGILMCLVCETALQATYLGTNNRSGQNAAIFFIFLFITPFWSTFMDASQFLYVAEIFPTHIRSQGMAVGMTGLYLADIILLVAGPIALNDIGWKFFFVLICPTALHILFVYFMCPETKGRSLVNFPNHLNFQSRANSDYRKISMPSSASKLPSTSTAPLQLNKPSLKRPRSRTRKRSCAMVVVPLVRRVLCSRKRLCRSNTYESFQKGLS